MDILSSENVHLGFYFVDLIFVVYQSTAKIGSLENFWLDGISLYEAVTGRKETLFRVLFEHIFYFALSQLNK